jgi:hypothetical protein
MKQGLFFLCLACCLALAAPVQAQQEILVKALKIKEPQAKALAKIKTDVYEINSKGILMAKKGYRILMVKSSREFVIEREEYTVLRHGRRGPSNDKKPIPDSGGAIFHCYAEKCGNCEVKTQENAWFCPDCRDCYGAVTFPGEGAVSEVQSPSGNWSPPIW